MGQPLVFSVEPSLLEIAHFNDQNWKAVLYTVYGLVNYTTILHNLFRIFFEMRIITFSFPNQTNTSASKWE